MQKLLKAKEVAEILNVSLGKVRQDILLRRLPVVKLPGGSVRVPLDELQRIITAGTVPAREVSRA
ncbi:MAG: helix-turn-helix domain-containing protein [Terriglobia bacterium]